VGADYHLSSLCAWVWQTFASSLALVYQNGLLPSASMVVAPNPFFILFFYLFFLVFGD
jgi:hypothetical protein